MIEYLSEKEIDKILDAAFKAASKAKENKNYRDTCPHYKNNLCRGDVCSSNTGCAFCKKNEIYDYDYAEPAYATPKFEQLEEKRIKARKNAVNNCKLSIDDNFCGYKNTFNYCSICNKVFKREKER